MRLYVKFNHWFPKLIRMGGIALIPFILYARTREEISESLLKHEYIHVEQVRKLGWFRFYFLYLWYYFKNLIKFRNHDEAYYQIPFEKEAYEKEHLALEEYEKIDMGLI